ncbi:uncharacterized protein [Typha latifolia]|uniref:uncharacterized protein n=1 Tax=Typha latifolia TaxID=4733 RepID=UPI003C2B8304
MSRINRSKGTSERSSNEGTSARTRPFSFEKIMLHRKKKLNPEEIKTDLRESFGNDGDEILSDHIKPERTDTSMKDLKYMGAKKEDRLKSTIGSEYVKGKSSNTERGRDRERMDEKNSHIRIRNDNRSGAAYEKLSERKQQNETAVKDISMERDRKSTKEGKRKSHGHNDGKIRSEIDGSSSKKHGSGKSRDLDYEETNDRRKVHSKPHYEELRSKRRRSRSREYDRERDRRSVSSSPKAHKRPYHGKDYAESLFESFKEKSRRRYSEVDRNRSSGNGGYASGHHRKHDSRLGGYSPRKRKTEAAVRTPSPTVRSPERKTSTWDQPPAGSSNPGVGSKIAKFQPPSIKIHEMPSSISVTPVTVKPQSAPSLETVLTAKNASIDSVQLTQATRPLRRLYIENVPVSASDKTVIDCLNDFLLSSGVNHIQGTKPCISCIINKEKYQALVEFLTPEDATAALSFDGRSLSGSILKIRRPKDYIETATATPVKPVEEVKTPVPEKPVEVVKVISDVVKDSPRKIFIGGISGALSSQMLMEIISAFGPLAAYRFVYNEELNGPCAYLEYVDSSITLKACAGLNGMKLGGHVLTALQALPDSPEEEGNSEVPPFYGIPLHAKPLLADATKVLQLKNVFDQDELLLLSVPELEETLEDIRLECARFGIVKSVNVVRQTCSSRTATDAAQTELNGGLAGTESRTEIGSLKKSGDAPNKNGAEEHQAIGGVPEDKRTDNTVELVENLERKEPADSFPSDGNVVWEPLLPDGSSGDQQNDSVYVEEKITGSANGIVSRKADCCTIQVADLEHAALGKAEVEKADGSMPLEISSFDVPRENELEESRNGGNKYVDDTKGTVEAVKTEVDSSGHDLDALLPGSVLVEFTREEAACMAAHSLHGRLYGQQVVMAGYAPHDLYLARFGR